MATYWENSCSFGLRYVSWYKFLIVSFVFSHLGFWSGNLFLIAPFPDLCLLVPFYLSDNTKFGLKSSKDQNSSKKVYSYAALNYVFIRKITTQLCIFSMTQEENSLLLLR